jgi:hypothetical protein
MKDDEWTMYLAGSLSATTHQVNVKCSREIVTESDRLNAG